MSPNAVLPFKDCSTSVADKTGRESPVRLHSSGPGRPVYHERFSSATAPVRRTPAKLRVQAVVRVLLPEDDHRLSAAPRQRSL